MRSLKASLAWFNIRSGVVVVVSGVHGTRDGVCLVRQSSLELRECLRRYLGWFSSASASISGILSLKWLAKTGCKSSGELGTDHQESWELRKVLMGGLRAWIRRRMTNQRSQWGMQEPNVCVTITRLAITSITSGIPSWKKSTWTSSLRMLLAENTSIWHLSIQNELMERVNGSTSIVGWVVWTPKLSDMTATKPFCHCKN